MCAVTVRCVTSLSRQRPQQDLRVLVLRVGEHLLGRPLLDDAALVHHRDVVGDRPGQTQVVGDHQCAEAQVRAQAQQQREDLAAHRRVQRCDGLVGDQERGAQRQGAGDHHPLPLPAGELTGQPPGVPLGRPELRLLQRGGDDLALVTGQAVHPRTFRDGLVDGVPGVQRAGRVLQHQLHLTAVRAQPAVRAGAAAARRT